MSKTFTVVGVSRTKAKEHYKFRVANGSAEDRTKRLIRSGFLDVQMFDIEPTSKIEALDWFEKNHQDLAEQIVPKQLQAMRGKLGKTAKAEAMSEAEATGETPKAKRGRKPKVKVEAKEAKLEAEAKPKRGRRPKEVSLKPVAEKEDNEGQLSPAAKQALKRLREAMMKHEKSAVQKAAKEAMKFAS